MLRGGYAAMRIPRLRADKVQHGLWIAPTQIRPFRGGLLNPVFTKHPVADGHRFRNALSRLRLADRRLRNRRPVAWAADKRQGDVRAIKARRGRSTACPFGRPGTIGDRCRRLQTLSRPFFDM